MDYEKMYKEALEKARKKHDSKYHPDMGPGGVYLNNADLEEIFPELRESEDEKIREVLMHIVKGACSRYGIKYIGDKITEEMLLAYLEKQKDHLRDSAKKVEQESIDGKALLHTADKSYRIGYRDGFNAKMPVMPPEWSVEDEVYLQNALWCVEQASKVARGGKDLGACLSAGRWLKSLPEKFVLQPKQERSERDESIIEGACNALEIHGHRKLASMLKSVHPQPKVEWSENDKAFLKVAIAVCNKYSHKDIADWLKSLRPQPQYKPSEEQIDALRRMKAAIAGEGEIYKPLNSLYEQLKKLM